MSAIDDLENKVRRLKDELRTAEEKLTAARIEASGIKIGTIMVHTINRGKRRGQTERGMVTGFSTRYSTPRTILRLFKADGTLGLRTTEDFFRSWKPET